MRYEIVVVIKILIKVRDDLALENAEMHLNF